MSTDIRLDVIYQELKDVEKQEKSEEIELDQIKSEEVSVNQDNDCEKKEDDCCKENKKKRRRACRSLCACFGTFTFIMMIVYSIIFLSVSVRVYMNMKQCFHSRDNIYKESSIVDKHVNQIHFDVVSGIVNVGFHNKPNIFIRVWDNARSKEHLEANSFDSGVSINNTVIMIRSVTSAFNFNSCKHAKIEIFIPNSYHQLIAITGTVKLGWVNINGNGSALGNVEVKVEVGKLSIEQVSVSSHLNLNTDLGLIKVWGVAATESAAIHSHTGIIRTYDVITKNFQTTSQFGCSKHSNLIADVVKLDTKFGFATVDSIYPNLVETELSMKTEYGRSELYLDSSEVNFKMGTTKGNMIVDYEGDEWVCKVDSSISLMSGKCTSIEKMSTKSLVNIDINTKYGTSFIVVDYEDDDE